MKERIKNYLNLLAGLQSDEVSNQIQELANAMYEAWATGKHVYICGNGGSAGNAIHLANDFNYGINKSSGIGLRMEALPANSSVITCIANDEGYDKIYSQQLTVKAEENDVLIILSGSGNSPNVVEALKVGNSLGMKTFAILGFSGGKCKEIAKYPIHFPVQDMQISEDLQLIIGHIIMQWFCDQPKPNFISKIEAKTT